MFVVFVFVVLVIGRVGDCESMDGCCLVIAKRDREPPRLTNTSVLPTISKTISLATRPHLKDQGVVAKQVVNIVFRPRKSPRCPVRRLGRLRRVRHAVKVSSSK